MRFNSEHFLYFYGAVFLIFFRLPVLGQRLFLIAASYYFYMAWKPEYIGVIALLTLIDFFSGRIIASADKPSYRKLALGASLTANLSLLFAFKYYAFFSQALAETAGVRPLGELPSFFKLLPIGLSFHTFQSISYIVDVYRKKVSPERNLGRFALFIAFFPQMVAGPIERASSMLPQLRGLKKFDYEVAASGVLLMAFGFVKKIVIADSLAPAVDSVYSNCHDFGSIDFMLASYFFAIQIYCDFSGYTDIARGCARVLGFELSENFRSPYLSSSVVEFWRRWHISLSNWFKDYVYLPLGGSRGSELRTSLNLFIVFLVSGLWHGANWTFIVWGLLHGIYVVIFRLTGRLRNAAWEVVGLRSGSILRTVISVLFTIHLVTLAWVFFRANSVSDAIYIAKGFFAPISGRTGHLFVTQMATLSIRGWAALFAFGAVIGLESLNWDVRSFRSQSAWVRWPVYCATSLLLLMFGTYGKGAFIYFQF